jgi:hypothetical protein
VTAAAGPIASTAVQQQGDIVLELCFGSRVAFKPPAAVLSNPEHGSLR